MLFFHSLINPLSILLYCIFVILILSVFKGSAKTIFAIFRFSFSCLQPPPESTEREAASLLAHCCNI